jgi:hypothetical protein
VAKLLRAGLCYRKAAALDFVGNNFGNAMAARRQAPSVLWDAFGQAHPTGNYQTKLSSGNMAINVVH